MSDFANVRSAERDGMQFEYSYLTCVTWFSLRHDTTTGRSSCSVNRHWPMQDGSLARDGGLLASRVVDTPAASKAALTATAAGGISLTGCGMTYSAIILYSAKERDVLGATKDACDFACMWALPAHVLPQ